MMNNELKKLSYIYHSAFIIFLLVRSFQFLRDKRYYNVFSFTRN